MKKFLAVWVVASFLSTAGASTFPPGAEEPLKRDPRVTDTQLIKGKVKLDFKETIREEEDEETGDDVTFYDYSADYSMLVTLPLKQIKKVIGDVQSYVCYMPGQYYSDMYGPNIHGSKTGGNVVSAKFGIDVLVGKFLYAIDITTKINEAKRFGTVWEQNDYFQEMINDRNSEAFHFYGHVGSWYAEPFAKDEHGRERYYLRYRDTIRFAEQKLKGIYEEGLKITMAQLTEKKRNGGKGFYNYSDNCPEKENQDDDTRGALQKILDSLLNK